MRKPLAFALLAAVLPVAATPRQDPAPRGYYRSPAIHGDTIVFTAEGDLWTVPVRGGDARRLTTGSQEDLRAAISPDGATVAFSGGCEGPTEVYVMPLAGGLPRRLTWEGAPAGVAGWTPDGRILYATSGSSTLPSTHDGKKLLVSKADRLYVIEASSGAAASLDKAQVNLADWSFPLDPREEWRQMFDEAWRLERDYFYDRSMHGLDWAAIRSEYRPLVDRVTDRAELSNLLAQMVSELSALHIFVYGGDARSGADQVQPASLGADLTRDSAAGGWRVTRVFRGDPDYPASLAPLAQPGVDVRTGDVVQLINGVGTLSVASPGELMRRQAGKQVLLRIGPASGGATRDVIVTPITPRQADSLRYDDWERSRRERVDSAAGGQIGYVHLRARRPRTARRSPRGSAAWGSGA